MIILERENQKVVLLQYVNEELEKTEKFYETVLEKSDLLLDKIDIG